MLPRENPLSPRPCRLGALSLSALGLSLGFALLAAPAQGQLQSRGAPSDSYFLIIPVLNDGNYLGASKAFNTELRNAIKVGPMRWIDSICYYTMIGECFYQMGDLPRALECYTAALDLYLQFPDWMLRVEFAPSGIKPLGARPQTPWGMSTRPTQLGQYPVRSRMLQGRIDNSEQVKTGGVVQLPFMYPVCVEEIVRCTGLAIRRRAALLGPLAKYDPMNQRLLTATAQPVGPRNHWSAAYVDLLYGLALAANDKRPEAATVLLRASVAAGHFDHPMTSTALLELGRLQLEQGNYTGARQLFLEATYAAYHYSGFVSRDVGILEEAFRHASLAHLLANEKTAYGALGEAAVWARQKNCRQLHVSVCLCAAEQALIAGQSPQAMTLLTEAQAAIGRRPMGAGWIGARLNFLRAAALFQQGQADAGDKALAAAMAYMAGGSHWLFHIARADAFVMANARTTGVPRREGLDLYRELLRDPQPADWTRDPMESLAVLMTPHPQVFEHWFLLAVQGTDPQAAPMATLEIADRVRRHRFFSSLAYGGRLQALRWVLEAPPEALDGTARVERQNLLVQYPQYRALSEQARQLRAALAAMPMLPADAELMRKQRAAFVELGKVSLQQEALLRQMAVRREPAGLVFPPLRTAKEVQQALPKGTAMMAFFVAGGQLHGFLLNQDRCQYWTVKNAAPLPRQIANLLREMGNIDQNRELTSKDLNNPQWKQSAQQILAALLEGSHADFTRKFPELVVVPDGVLWYLPFEALTVKVDGQLQPLISRFRIRYAPMMSLGVPDGRGRTLRPETLVVAGRLHPKDDFEVAQAAFEQLAKAIPPAALADKGPLPACSALFKVRTQELIVLDDLGTADLANYTWSPIPIDRGKPGNTLGDWLGLPWGGPEVVILPGIQTLAGSGFKRNPRMADGSDLFLAVCGLLTTGTRTALVSRWRPGGQSAIELVREFAQELPNTTPADAWQRAVLLLADSRLNPEKEPRVKLSGADEPLKGDHPFFWAAYMLVDSGDLPAKGEAGAAKKKPSPDAQRPKQPEQPLKPAQPGTADGAQKPEPPAELQPAKKREPVKKAGKPAPAGES